MRCTPLALVLAFALPALLGSAPPPAPVTGGAAASPPAATAVEPDLRSLVRTATTALDAEDYTAAAGALEALERLQPEDATVPFNLGVAKYRSGDFGAAAEAFERAHALADDPDLRGSSLYNLGNSAYNAARQQDPSQSAQAKEGLQRSLERFKEALRVNPEDEDACANAEYVTRRLRQMEQMEQPQEQGGQQDQMEEQDDPEQQRQQQQEGDQRDQQQQGGDEQTQQGQGQDQDQTQNEASEEQQRREEQQEGQREGEESQQAEGEQQDDSEDEQQDPQGAGREGEEEQRMTPEEARRLLQGVRDKERQRRRELAERNARQPKPVIKDW
ncbi:MAG: tetratricopeptide repeat protein [Planctomycetota bacterium]|jgi:tetratricopeptide (TPR) repeat protein